ncbi:hypothetical protein WR25_26553 [Diploscapter pachys]|uniref:Uncharacterized protein n=1 Tax=Diploscapter pachys TaxID=2018661 RepID=A0A2A2LIE1_9BILA|nr:hypothetical protein WR25_26553 [Diploscapter pachys]
MDFEAEDLKSASLTLAVLLPFSVLLSFACGAYFYGVIIVRLLYNHDKLSSFQKIVLSVAVFSMVYHTTSLVNTFNPYHLGLWSHYNSFDPSEDHLTLSFWGLIGFSHGSFLVIKKVFLSILMLHKTLIFKRQATLCVVVGG